MARPLRLEYPGAWFHVMNRGQCKRPVFLTPDDRKTFLDIIFEAVETFRIEVHAYSLLDNHYHLLIHTPEMGLARAMRHINGVYTQKFNIAHRRDGPLFRGRYKAKIVDKDEYLMELLRYIHMNAVKAGHAKVPGEYRWSSHRFYLEPQDRPAWLCVDEMLGYFGKRRHAAVRALDKFVRAGVPDLFEEAMQKNSTVIGSEGFKNWVYDNLIDAQRTSDKEIPKRDKRILSRAPMWSEILSSLAFACDVPVGRLRCKQPGRKNEARLMAIYLTRRLTGKSHKEIAKLFGMKSEYTIAKAIERFKKMLDAQRALKNRTDAICRNILYNVKT